MGRDMTRRDYRPQKWNWRNHEVILITKPVFIPLLIFFFHDACEVEKTLKFKWTQLELNKSEDVSDEEGKAKWTRGDSVEVRRVAEGSLQKL